MLNLQVENMDSITEPEELHSLQQKYKAYAVHMTKLARYAEAKARSIECRRADTNRLLTAAFKLEREMERIKTMLPWWAQWW